MINSNDSLNSRVCRRPVGVTIIAIIEIIWSVLMIIASIGMFVMAGMIEFDGIPEMVMETVPPDGLALLPISWITAGIMMMAFGLIGLAISWGLLKGRNWARVLLIVFLLLSILSSVLGVIMAGIMTPDVLISLGISIIIPVIFIWYLALRHVSDWFHCIEIR